MKKGKKGTKKQRAYSRYTLKRDASGARHYHGLSGIRLIHLRRGLAVAKDAVRVLEPIVREAQRKYTRRRYK